MYVRYIITYNNIALYFKYFHVSVRVFPRYIHSNQNSEFVPGQLRVYEFIDNDTFFVI